MKKPVDLDQATAAEGEYRAGGTDLQARRRLGLSRAEIIDLRHVPGLDRITWSDDGTEIGAMVRIATVATDRPLADAYPGLSATAGALATPQIRAVATVGGNLLQRTRCPYYRHPGFECLKSGGGSCPAREGQHGHGVIFDESPCVAPHPSSLAMALIAYEGRVTVAGGPDRSVVELLGDGSDGSRDNQLDQGEVLATVRVGPPVAERAAYGRVAGRVLAEWPTVEAICRLGVDEGAITWAVVVAGAVAPVPRRLTAVEQALVGREVEDPELLRRATAAAAEGASPLPMTAHKPLLLSGLVADVVERALAGSPGGEASAGERGL